jgi:hypothetical protein
MWALPIVVGLSPRPAIADELARRYDGDDPVIFRMGALASADNQSAEVAVGARFDIVEMAPQLRLAADITLGGQPHGATVEPMLGVRLPFGIADAPKAHPYLGAFIGPSYSWSAGVSQVALPLRLATGATYEVLPHLGFGFELGLEAGPMLSPRGGSYAALQLGVMVCL